MNYLKKPNYGDLKFKVNSTALETDFSELKDSVAFLDSIKNREISIEEAWYKQKEFRRYWKGVRIGNKSEKQKNNEWLILISFCRWLRFNDSWG